MFNLFRHELQSRWIAIIGWGIGLTLFGGMYITVYPEVADQMAGLAELSIYKIMGIDLGSFAGYIASVAVQYNPLLLAIFAVMAGTGTLAGEEGRGTLELVMSMPLKRWQIVTMKAAAIAVAALLILIITGVGTSLILAWVKTWTEADVTPIQLFLAMLNGWPITLAFTMIALFLGAYLPTRMMAGIVGAVIIVASYFGQILTNMVESLEFVRPFSLFHYFDTSVEVFSQGPQIGDVLVLLVVAAIFFVLALLAFQRRNVTVSAWPWQRATVTE